MARSRTKATMIAVVLALTITGCNDSRKADFIRACQRRADINLRSPASARYGPIWDVLPNPNPREGFDKDAYGEFGEFGRFWIGYVDSQNAFGASGRNYVLCMEKDGTLDVGLSDDYSILPAWISE